MSDDCRLEAVGMVNALGAGLGEIWPRVMAGDVTGLRPPEPDAPPRGDYAGPLPAVPEALARYACRNNAMALAALSQIETPVRDALAATSPQRVAVVVGTSTSGVSDAELAIGEHQRSQRLAPAFDYAQLEFGGLAAFLAEVIGTGGPAYTISTACSSGARALASARSLLRLGLCDAVLAGACDTSCGLTSRGFAALHAVSAGRTNPMSANRDGLTLGEGAALFLVTRASGGIQFAGVGESSEAHHMSAPDPEGRGAAAAMQMALHDADAEASDVAYLNLHGTGTPLNDAMESVAVRDVLGPDAPCSSTKALTGHTLGAAGAMEAGICWQVLAEGESTLPLPPHCYDGEPDPALPKLHLVAQGETAEPAGRRLVMSNSFGFGGNNCVLVLEDAR